MDVGLDPFANLVKTFEIMESKGEIDLSVISELDNTINDCVELEDYWLSKFSGDHNSFHMYRSLRNIKFHSNKMKERVLHSAENTDNPQIAIDALKILPVMSEIFNLALTLQEETLQYSIINHIKKLTRSLRKKSSQLGLLPTVEDGIKDINIEEIRSRFTRLAEKIQDDIYDI